MTVILRYTSSMIFAPTIDPVAIQLGPLAIHWYGLAYIAGIIGGYLIVSPFLKSRLSLNSDQIQDFVVYVTIGIILGGRLGYILFYQLDYYLTHPLELFAVWNGGMSYHGGAIGALIGTLLFARVSGKSGWTLMDFLGLGSTV